MERWLLLLAQVLDVKLAECCLLGERYPGSFDGSKQGWGQGQEVLGKLLVWILLSPQAWWLEGQESKLLMGWPTMEPAWGAVMPWGPSEELQY